MFALEIKDLFFRYEKDGPLILDGLSLSVEKGQYVSIMGHNGSGKSTLAKLIIGLINKESGFINVFNQELTENNVRDIRYQVGIVFQNPDNQFIGATVKDDIAFGLENHLIEQKKMDDIIIEFAKKVNMIDFLDKEPSSLSGGQKQRVAIAGVLAMNPKILILDEATSMLDPKGKSEIISLIHALRKENPSLTILSITHDEEEAFLSDKVIILDEGKVVLNDIPRNVFKEVDLINKVGLDLPFEYKIKYLLNKNNFEIDFNDSLDEVKNKLCQ